MKTAKLTIGLAAGLFALAAHAGAANAVDYVDAVTSLPTNAYGGPRTGNPGSYQLIEILDVGDSGVTNGDGTIFTATANPTNPSSGTGVFQPFKRVQRSTTNCKSNGGSGDCIRLESDGTIKLRSDGTVNLTSKFNDITVQNGFNTDAGEPGINFDMKNGSSWTRSVTMSEFDFGTTGYIELLLDANQNGSATSAENKLVITDMQIYILPPGAGGDNPESVGGGVENTGYDGAIFNPTNNKLLGYDPIWQLDQDPANPNGNGNVDLLLQASICDCKGQGGSGHGDLSVFVPTTGWSYGDDWNFLLYTEYLYVNDGFEEWSFRDAPGGTKVSEPGALAVFGFGLAGLGFYRRRRRAAA